ncbi:MAG: hypothetical protein WA364_18690 [Candidatus Nitrosopolaris sp.]
MINQSRGGKSIGFVNPRLYRYTVAFNDITAGNNDTVGHGNFQTGPGWDACTGLGSPNGQRIMDIFRNLSLRKALTNKNINLPVSIRGIAGNLGLATPFSIREVIIVLGDGDF